MVAETIQVMTTRKSSPLRPRSTRFEAKRWPVETDQGTRFFLNIKTGLRRRRYSILDRLDVLLPPAKSHRNRRLASHQPPFIIYPLSLSLSQQT